jgi:hypothetical protein
MLSPDYRTGLPSDYRRITVRSFYTDLDNALTVATHT